MHAEHSAKCLVYNRCLTNVRDTYCYQAAHMTSHSLILCGQFFKLLYFLYSKLPLIVHYTTDLIATYKNKKIITQ